MDDHELEVKEEGFDTFFSYSWRGERGEDWKDRVTRLAKRLHEKYGVKVWQDVEQLRGGSVQEQLAKGIRNSEFFIPMLTKDYIRKVDGETLVGGDDGKKMEDVRREFIFGMKQRGVMRSIPVVLQPELLNQDQWGDMVTMDLGTLFYVDYTRDDLLESATDNIYTMMQTALATKAVQHQGQGTVIFEVDTEMIFELPKQKAAEYVEGTRLYIYESLWRDWVMSNNWSQVFVLLGVAGVGKSVCMAHLAELSGLFERGRVMQKMQQAMRKSSESRRFSNPLRRLSLRSKALAKPPADYGMCIIGIFFYKFDDKLLRSMRTAIYGLAAQLCDTVPGYYTLVKKMESSKLRQMDLISVFDEVIVKPLNKLPKKPYDGFRASIIIDAFDECRQGDQKDMRVVIKNWKKIMPSWCGLMLSSRPQGFELEDFMDEDGNGPTVLDTQSETNMFDMKVYLKARLEEYMRDSRTVSKAATIVAEKSRGHFMYARFVKQELEEMEKGTLTLDMAQDEKLFPTNVQGFYVKYFTAAKEALKSKPHLYQRFFGSLCVSRAPLPKALLPSILETRSMSEALKILNELRHLLVVSDDSVRFVNKSMSDFILGDDADSSLKVDTGVGQKAMADFCRNSILENDYAARNGIFHLSKDGDMQSIADLLLSFDALDCILVKFAVPVRVFVSDLNRFFVSDDTTTSFRDSVIVIRALEKSLAALEEDPRELTSQILGRFSERSHPLVKNLPKKLGFPWLRPAMASLIDASNPLRKSFTGHADDVAAVDMDVDEDIVASGSDDGTLKIWRLSTGQCIRTLNTGSPVQSVVVDGNRVFSAGEEARVRLWDRSSGECVKSFDACSAEISGIAVRSDLLVCTAGVNIKVFSVESGDSKTEILKAHKLAINDVAILTEKLLISGSSDGSAKIWNLRDGKCRSFLDDHEDSVYAVSGDSQTAVTGSIDHTIKVWKVSDGSLMFTLKGHENWVNCVVSKGDFIVSGSSDHTVRVWSIKDRKEIRRYVGHASWVNDIAVEDEYIVSASLDSTLKLWPLLSRKVTELPERDGHSAEVKSVAIGESVVVSGSKDSLIKVWDTKTGKLLHNLRGHRGSVHAVRVDGKEIISGSSDKTVRIWKVNGESVAVLEGHEGKVFDVGFREDMIVSGGSGGCIKFWSRGKNPKCKLTIHDAHKDDVTSVGAYAEFFVSASKDKTAKVWTRDGDLMHVLEGHTGWISKVAVRSGRVITWSHDYGSNADNSMMIWSLRSGKLIDKQDNAPNSASGQTYGPWNITGKNFITNATTTNCAGFHIDLEFSAFGSSETIVAVFDNAFKPHILKLAN